MSVWLSSFEAPHHGAVHGAGGSGQAAGMHRADHHPVDKSALALVMHRIEGAGKSDAEREHVATRMDAGRNKTPKGGGGLSPEAVAIIRAEVEGDWHRWTPETHDEGAHRLDIDSHPMRRSGPS